ncbi:hypothetical protein A1351_20640 [Methylosinus sp. R-45379]|nr:hypothetical protein A1351_20640 [Methylosinus sp. R-45379]
MQWEREVYEQVEQDMFPMNVRIAAGRAYRCGYDQAESDRARMLTGKGTWVDSWCSELKGP